MTQIIVTLENNADETLLRRMIENMRGVMKTSLSHNHKDEVKVEKGATKNSQWLETIHSIKKSIDPSIIDTSDPRVNYIMSK